MIRSHTSVVRDNSSLVTSLYHKAAVEALKAAADDTVSTAKSRVPVDSGDLKDSIKADLSEIDKLRVEVKADEDYALVVELGSHNRPAHPFLGNSAEEASKHIPQIVKAVLDKGPK